MLLDTVYSLRSSLEGTSLASGSFDRLSAPVLRQRQSGPIQYMLHDVGRRRENLESSALPLCDEVDLKPVLRPMSTTEA
jgi:hypothetical protein